MAKLILSPQQEAFCLAYVEPNATATAAYRAAYNCSKMKPETVNRRAFDLMQDGKITARIQELRDKAAEKAILTLENHLRRLDDLSRKAEADEQYGAAITAEISRGKAAGLYSEKIKHEHTGADGAPIQTQTEILLTLVRPHGHGHD